MDDELQKFEAMLGAFSNMASPPEEELIGVKCPRCDGTSFAKVQDVYEAAAARAGDAGDPQTPREGGLTDAQILDRLAPNMRRSATTMAIVIAVPLGGAAAWVYMRYGSLIGELAIFAAAIVVIIFFLTRTRTLSDAYYTGRARWRRLHICRKCGQLVDPGVK